MRYRPLPCALLLSLLSAYPAAPSLAAGDSIYCTSDGIGGAACSPNGNVLCTAGSPVSGSQNCSGPNFGSAICSDLGGGNGINCQPGNTTSCSTDSQGGVLCQGNVTTVLFDDKNAGSGRGDHAAEGRFGSDFFDAGDSPTDQIFNSFLYGFSGSDSFDFGSGSANSCGSDTPTASVDDFLDKAIAFGIPITVNGVCVANCAAATSAQTPPAPSPEVGPPEPPPPDPAPSGGDGGDAAGETGGGPDPVDTLSDPEAPVSDVGGADFGSGSESAFGGFDGAGGGLGSDFGGFDGAGGSGGGGGSVRLMFEPINAVIGNKIHPQIDYAGRGAFPLRFGRVYNSTTFVSGAKLRQRVGANWRSSYDRTVMMIDSTHARINRPDGKSYVFTLVSGAWKGDADVVSQLTPVVGGGWKYTTRHDGEEIYDAQGKLTSIANRKGLRHTLSYDARGRLTTVADPFNRTLQFGYDNQNRLVTLTNPAQDVTTYAYDSKDNLVSVTYPDGKTRRYLYENASFYHALTGVVDENGTRFVTFGYDSQGRAVSGSLAGGMNQVTLSFGNGTTNVTDVVGTTRTRTITTVLGDAKVAGITAACQTNCGSPTQTNSFGTNGFVASHVNRNGVTKSYSYDSRGLLNSVTRASGTSLAQPATIIWHQTWRRPTQVTLPNRTINYAYDAHGNRTQTAVTAGGVTRAWNYTYNAQGQLTQINGPRTDVSDVTTFTYDNQGNVASATNALGHTTQFTAYNAHGQALTIIDPNGLTLQRAYDKRGRVSSVSAAGLTTSFTYDNVGQLTKATFADGSFLTYTRNGAHRLTQVTDTMGNTVRYTLDNAGRATKTEVFDPAGVMVKTGSAIYDGLNRLIQHVGAQQQTTALAYDNLGQITGVTDPLQQISSFSYDALSRLLQHTNPAADRTQFSYNTSNRLTVVNDPRGLATNNTVNGFGQTTQVASPDAGARQRTFDPMGNLLSGTDAKNQTTSYQYDVLNRPTRATRADGSVVTYQYDVGTNGKGRLTQITDPSGSTSYTYNNLGRLTQQTQMIGTVARTTSYAYNVKGQLSSMTYPSGTVINYTYNSNGQVVSVAKGATTLVSNITYRPFGPMKSWTLANGQTVTRTFDMDGRMTGNSIGTLSYDAASRITGAYGQTFNYDSLDRLTSYADQGTSQSMSYDAGHNRLQLTVPGTNTTYAIDQGSNRLMNITVPGNNQTYVHDANGSVTADGVMTYSYDGVGKLIAAAAGGGSGQYVYNGHGQRVKKTVAGASTLFVHSHAGQLMGEYTATGALIQETIYLAGAPIAMLKPAGTYYVHTDHLGTPRRVYDGSRNLRWQWDPASFGANPPNENPAGMGTFANNLRFPGQYFDAETGLHYNNARYYNPNTGRYLQSDPMGIGAGTNAYRYGGGNPVGNSDLTGLDTYVCTRPLNGSGGLSVGPFYHQYTCVISDRTGDTTCKGLAPTSSAFGSPGLLEDDRYDPTRCRLADGPNICLESCILGKLNGPLPRYDVFQRDGAQQCQTFSNSVVSTCQAQCRK